MTLRTAVPIFCAFLLSCYQAFASQPEGYAGRLVPSPLFTDYVGDPSNPPVVCGGFHWTEEGFSPAQLGSEDRLTFQMALIPFRSQPTSVLLFDAVAGPFVRIRFIDGLVRGVAYDRSNWNDVSLLVRPATQDFLITVNGAQAGPFPLESGCQQGGGCFGVKGFAVAGEFLDDDVEAWIDSISLIQESASGAATLYEEDFNTCFQPHASLGSLVISSPPKGGPRGPKAPAGP